MTDPAFANIGELIRNWNADKADLLRQSWEETNGDIRYVVKKQQAYIGNTLRVPISPVGFREPSTQTDEQHIPKPRSSLQPGATVSPTWPCEQTPLGLQKSLESGVSPITNDLAFYSHYQKKDQGSFQASSQTPYLAEAYPNSGNGRPFLSGVAIQHPIPPRNHSRRASLPAIAMSHPIPPRYHNRKTSLPCSGSSLVSSQRIDFLAAVDCQTSLKKRQTRLGSFPYRLHLIISGPDSQEYIAWLPHGRAFRVLKQKGIEEFLFRFFKSRRYESFQRQVCQCGMTECCRS
jgi:hypothetical protein